MTDFCCGLIKKNKNRKQSNEEGTELTSSPQHTTGNPRRRGGNQNSGSLIPTSAYPVGHKENPRRVEGNDYDQYMRVDNIQIVHQVPTNEPHEAGHNFVVEFTVTNTTSDYLDFNSAPPLVWREIENKEENTGGTRVIIPTKDRDLYAEKPEAHTFSTWHSMWKNTIAPEDTKKIVIGDKPRLRNINEDANGQPRTVSRSIDFDIRVPGSNQRLRATQIVNVDNGVTETLDFQVH